MKYPLTYPWHTSYTPDADAVAALVERHAFKSPPSKRLESRGLPAVWTNVETGLEVAALPTATGDDFTIRYDVAVTVLPKGATEPISLEALLAARDVPLTAEVTSSGGGEYLDEFAAGIIDAVEAYLGA